MKRRVRYPLIAGVIFLWAMLMLCAASAKGATYYTGPAATGDGTGSDESNLMAWSAVAELTAAKDTVVIRGMDSTISDSDWVSGRFYFTDQIRMYATYTQGWTFGADYRVGQFANRDIWVWDQGPGVNITAFEPLSQHNETQSLERNGATVNPIVIAAHGYDGRVGGYNTSYPNVAHDVGVTGTVTVNAGESVVSVISLDAMHPTEQTYIQSATVLTVLAAPADDGDFRPPYAGTDKTIKYNLSDLNYDAFADMTSVGTAPSWATVNAYVARPWIDHFGTSAASARALHPLSDTGHAYAAYWAEKVAQTLLKLNTSDTDANKKRATIGLVQMGIDVNGVLHSSTAGREFLHANGGQCNGRLMPILVAGLVLGDADLLAVATESPAIDFQELQQYTAITASDIYGIPYTTRTWLPDPSGRGSAGTVHVINGSTAVHANTATTWLSIASDRRKMFGVVDDPVDAYSPEGYAYTCTVNTNTTLTLGTAYRGPTNETAAYTMGSAIMYGHADPQAMISGSIRYPQNDFAEYLEGDAGLPEWFEAKALTVGVINRAYLGRTIPKSYEAINVQGQGHGAVPLCLLAMGLVDEWSDNAYFDYYDRWYDVCGFTSTRSLAAWPEAMWHEHRDDYAGVRAQWTPIASTPSPADASTDVSDEIVLGWCDGNGGYGVTYNVYFGTDATPDATELIGNQAALFYTPTVAAATQYWWRIDMVVNAVVYTGTVWTFTTGTPPLPPGKARIVSPANSPTATGPRSGTLSWTTGGDTLTYDVWIKVNAGAMTKVSAAQAATTYDYGPYSYDDDIDWRIDATNAHDTTTGDTWEFKIESESPPAERSVWYMMTRKKP